MNISIVVESWHRDAIEEICEDIGVECSIEPVKKNTIMVSLHRVSDKEIVDFLAECADFRMEPVVLALS